MPTSDRQKWNHKYLASTGPATEPSALITALERHLPETGRALDIAGGAGRHAIWLAQRGLEVTLVDVAPAGLRIAEQRAVEAGVSLTTMELDLEQSAFPAGPWDLLLSSHYLQRSLFPLYPKQLKAGGILVCLQPTLTNLERHSKPSARFLLRPQELPGLVPDLEILHHHEGWLEKDRHEAILVARKPHAPA
ncbi:MAG: SAM-dependent methyltransferase [Planctomycetaceae bacterium]|nr:SAM-dependent methyltransferase [Planctomycetaceae bacterium]